MSGVVVLTSSALTDRMIVHTAFLRALEDCDTRIWACSAGNPRFQKMWDKAPAVVEPFPSLRPFPEFPHNYLRRLNEFTWDFRLRDPSRMSAMRHVRNVQQRAYVRALKPAARIMAKCHFHEPFEGWLEKMLIRYSRSTEARERLLAERPAAV